MKKLFALLIQLLSIVSMSAQTTQNIKGLIFDKQSEMPLIGATIAIAESDPLMGTTSDIDGYFTLPEIPLGRYDLIISYLGYQTITIPNVEVTAGKEVYTEIGLEESTTTLQEVVIRADVDKDKTQNELATISARTFSMEEVNKYSGGRSDIGRLVANFAGVSTADDARNDIVIRGNSPTGVLWRLEGIPIPNPNHFSTLGTTGGPVSALNPNMIKNSDFMTSAFPSEYGNALAGVFDLGLRSGNRDKHEFMFQTGAISGFEGVAEGPINQKKNSSYLFSARYSFVGLATGLGLPIGTNATPNYSDIAFNIDLGNSKVGKFSLFGIGGQSDIDFLHNEVDETDLFAANDQDAFPRSKFGVVGVKHNLILDSRTYVRTILASSTSSNRFDVDRYFNMDTDDESVKRIVENDNIENRTTLSTLINRKYNARLTARAGVLMEFMNFNLTSRTREFSPDWIDLYDFEGTTLLGQAYLQTQYKLNDKVTLNSGLHGQLLTLNNTWSLEPRLAVNYQLNSRNTLNIGYGLHSQTTPLPILLLLEEVNDGVFEETNRNLDMTRSHHFVLGYDTKFATDWRAKVEAYYQSINNVPVEPFESSFSLLNLGEDFGFPDDRFGLVNEGTGRNYGIEVTVEKFFSDGYYGLFTASIYDSRYTGSDGINRNTAFNNGYVFNALAGKEFKIGKEKRNAFTLDTRVTKAGGRYYTPVDLVASQAAGDQVLKEEIAFSERYSPYFRWDVKFGIKLNSKKRKLSHSFYMDIQNVTNRENVFARRYNRLTNQINVVNQLGFFPDFMYRIQF